MQSLTGLSQAPLKQCFSTFHYRTSSFCYFPIFSSLELSKHPAKNTEDFSRFWEASSHFIFLFQRKFPLLEIPHFSSYSNPHPHPKGTCSFNRPWCSSLNGNRASITLFIKNFFLRWSPHFFTFELPNYNPHKKVHAMAMAPHPCPTPRRQVHETDEPCHQ